MKEIEMTLMLYCVLGAQIYILQKNSFVINSHLVSYSLFIIEIKDFT